MDKIKYIPLALFVLFSGKALISGLNGYESAAGLLILGAISAFYEYKSQERAISLLTDELNKQRDEQKRLEKELETLKSAVSSIKLTNQFRQKAL